MNGQNEQFEQNALKYLDYLGTETYSEESQADSPPRGMADDDTPQAVYENRERDSVSVEEQQELDELEARMKAQAEQIAAQQQQQKVELSDEIAALQKQREEFFKNNDVKALAEKMKNSVNAESDRVFITWIITRFPQLFEQLTEEEQLALIRYYKL